MSKRLFDLCVVVSLAPLWCPLILCLMVLVRVALGGPVFFRQERPGYHGKPFTLIKFRTMKDLRDADGRLLEDKFRMTGFGRFLRSSSLDELPELFNVIRGEMSLVGPRPLLMEYLELYTEEQARRHDVPPGITGWAQINGRNAISWEEKFKLDLWYVDNRSVWLDIKVLVLTIWKVVARQGISQEGEVTAEKFTGSRKG